MHDASHFASINDQRRLALNINDVLTFACIVTFGTDVARIVVQWCTCVAQLALPSLIALAHAGACANRKQNTTQSSARWRAKQELKTYTVDTLVTTRASARTSMNAVTKRTRARHDAPNLRFV